ncbi:hypothetical protein PVMG_05077 [Plasmodium vivax Mauritania I]|uniref:Uncharacterized protein n=1 Tax=Plasmodium vivax Mauritania I TaxID=1035515 RepID=A0A0J9TIW3_PLAVI|nr:hypothetical protein PVMG_05077 [Plasmodium vivax Mauritania I]
MNSNESYFTDKETAKIICEQFLKLYVSLTDLKTKPKSDTNYKKSNGFLNYWVNFKLIKSIKKEDYTVHDVYDHLESQVFNIDGYDIHLNLICDIDKDELHKMNILYNLFENYGKLNAIKYDNVDEAKQALYLHSTACCTDYNKAKYICNGNNKVNNPKFCDKLETFESQYEQLYSEVLQKGSQFSDNLIKLSECPNNKIITTAVTGTVVGLIPLFGVLYKVSELNIKL